MIKTCAQGLSYSLQSNSTSFVIMNHNGGSPMWGSNPATVVAAVAGDEEMMLPSYDNTSSGDRLDIPTHVDLLNDISELSTLATNEYKEGNEYHQVVVQDQQGGMMRRSSSIEDIDKIIRREMQFYDIICAQENDKIRSTTHEVANDFLYAMPNKDILFEVHGANIGHVVKVGLRYSTGAHHNTPVRACKAHNDETDKYISFHVPKFNTKKKQDSGGHFILEIPVSSISNTGNIFKFSLVFRCLNSCHREYGKSQDLILQLFDQDNNLLKERQMPIRICKNVNRDKKPGREGIKRRGGKTVVPAPKRVKQEPEERDHAIQAGTLPLPYPGRKLCCQVMVDESHVPLLKELFKTLGAEVQWEEGYNHNGLSSGPPDVV